MPTHEKGMKGKDNTQSGGKGGQPHVFAEGRLFLPQLPELINPALDDYIYIYDTDAGAGKHHKKISLADLTVFICEQCGGPGSSVSGSGSGSGPIGPHGSASS